MKRLAKPGMRAVVRRLHSLAAGLVALSAALAPTATLASGSAAPAHGEATEAPEAPQRTDLLDVGAFRIRFSQPTDGEVIDLRFGVCFVLSSKTSAEDLHELQQWTHRLRDQVIIAVRSARPEDYNEPDLRRLQRLIMFRVKRLDASTHILGTYLTGFSLERGETMADLMVPAVTPSAAPPKSSGGGH